MTEGLLPEPIVRLAERVVEENTATGRKLVVAESCTGGLVAAALTEIPGSSSVLDRGFVTYSNEAKMEMLGVPSDIIETFGAVSVACVWAMAKGALERSNADVAVAISGVAGPGGGSTASEAGRDGGVRPALPADPHDGPRGRAQAVRGCLGPRGDPPRGDDLRAGTAAALGIAGRGFACRRERRRAASNAATIFRKARSKYWPASCFEHPALAKGKLDR